MEALRLEKKLPPSMRESFWSMLIDCFDLELQNLKTEIAEMKNTYAVENMNLEQLIEVSNLLGVVFNASVNDDTEFLRKETKEIPFKIQYKATAKLYKSFYKSLDRKGQFYIYYFKSTSNSIIRSAVSDPFTNLIVHDFEKPWHYDSLENFTGQIVNSLKLDTGLLLDVENLGELWTLDTVDAETSTNHIGIEFEVDRIIVKKLYDQTGAQTGTKEFLMTNDYFDYIYQHMDFTRRVKEVPHIGAHLCMFTDLSGVYNHGTRTNDNYTHPDIKTFCQVTPLFSGIGSYLDVSYIRFGIGDDYSVMKGVGDGPFTLTDLQQKVAKTSIFFNEKLENANFYMFAAEYRGQKINDFSLSDSSGYLLDDTFGNASNVVGTNIVNGINNGFWGTLLYSPLKRGSISIQFIHDGLAYQLKDDKKGNLVGIGGKGTVNYENGQYEFSTNFRFRQTVVVATGTLVPPVNSVSGFVLPKDLGSPDIYADTSDPIILSYVVLEGASKKAYQIQANSSGVFTPSGHLISGNVNLSTGVVTLNFDTSIAVGETVQITYSFQRTYTPDALTSVDIDYYFTNTPILITEAGLFDSNDNMIAYSMFPPFEFSSANFHMNLHFFISKMNFV